MKRAIVALMKCRLPTFPGWGGNLSQIRIYWISAAAVPVHLDRVASRLASELFT